MFHVFLWSFVRMWLNYSKTSADFGLGVLCVTVRSVDSEGLIGLYLRDDSESITGVGGARGPGNSIESAAVLRL